MTKEVENQPSETEELLLNELRAIKHWDAMYHKNQLHTPSDEHGFASRQKRRSEINRQLLSYGRLWNLIRR